jgi:hypothetical protein
VNGHGNLQVHAIPIVGNAVPDDFLSMDSDTAAAFIAVLEHMDASGDHQLEMVGLEDSNDKVVGWMAVLRRPVDQEDTQTSVQKSWQAAIRVLAGMVR